MADRSVILRLVANVAGFTGPMSAATASATGLNTSLSKTGTHAKGVDDLGKSAHTASTGTKVLGLGFLAVGAGVAATVKTFANFDTQMSAVEAATRATGTELESLREAAIDMGAATQFGATEAAEGIEALAKAGVSTADILGGALAGSLDLAAAGGIEVAEAAESASKAMTQFGLSGKDVTHVADLLAAGAGKAVGDVSDMSMALAQSGQVAAATGLSIEETVGTLAAFASNALIGSDAGTSFKTMLGRLAAPSAEAADIMAELGISAYDAAGNFVGIAEFAGQLQVALSKLTPEQRQSTLATVFGSDAVRAATILYKEGKGGVEEWTEAVDDSGFAAEQAAIRTDNFRGDLERAFGALEEFAIGTGETADGPLRKLTRGFTAAIEGINEWNRVAEEQGQPAIDDLGDAWGWLNEKTLEAISLGHYEKEVTEEVSDAQKDHASSTAEVAAQTDGLTQSIEDQTKALEELRDGYFKTMNAALGLSDATIGYEQALDDATTALDENERTLDINTQAGRDNKTALDNIASAALSVMDQMYATGASEADVTAKNATMRTSLYNAARQFGLTEQEALDYTNRVLGIPPTAKTSVVFSDIDARTKIQSFLKTLGGIPSSIPISIRATGSGGVGGPTSAGIASGNRVFPLPGGKGAYPVTQGLHPVNAIDYGARSGTPIYASFSGQLTTANLGNRSYGKFYRLAAAGQRPILGAHLSNFARGTGSIAQGQLIGWTGNTGHSIGAHFHLENFDTGGILGHGGLARNMSGRPERILNPAQTESFDKLVTVLTGGQGSSTSSRIYQITVNVPVSANPGAVGAEVVRTIQEYERRSGAGWRN